MHSTQHLLFSPLAALFFLVLSVMGTYAGPASGSVDSVFADWQVASSPLRAVYLSDDKAVSTVEIPARTANGVLLTDIAAFAGTKRLPVKPVFRTDKTITAVIDGSAVKKAGVEIALYGLPAALPGAPAFANDLPVHFRITQSGVFEAPPSVADMIAMADGHPRHPVLEFDLPSVGYLKSGSPGTPRGWHRSNWRNFTYLAEYSGLLRIEKSGPYRFATAKRATGPVYLIIGDELVIDVPNKGMHPLADRPKGKKGEALAPTDIKWHLGKTIPLKEGVVPFRALTFCKQFCEITLGWIPPAAPKGTSPVPLPDKVWAAAAPPRAVRLDRRDGPSSFTTAISIQTEKEDSYAVDGSDAIFMPSSIRSLHSRNAESAPDCSWKLIGDDDKDLLSFEGDELSAVLVKPNRNGKDPRINLTIRNDKTQQTACSETMVPFPKTAALRHRLTVLLSQLPPFVYDADRVQPEIQVRTTLPDKTPLLLRATFLPGKAASGKPPLVVEKETFPTRHWCRFVLPSKRVADIASIKWEVVHLGVTLAAGETIFMHAPFQKAPDAARGNELLAEGKPVVFVSRRIRNDTPLEVPFLRPGAEIILLDGFATPSGGFTEKTIGLFSDALGADTNVPSVRLLHPEDLPDKDILAKSHQELASLAHLSHMPQPGFLIIAPDFNEIAEGAPLEQFERHLAATIGIVRDVLKTPAIVLTPPPGLLSSANLETPPDMRPFAESVLRVADANNLPVADFYTLCKTHGADAVSPDGTITPEGARLAGEAVANRIKR